MSEYIERDKLIAFLDANHDENDWMVNQYNADWICSWIDSQPTADVVEVKHGRWETDKEDIEWGNALKRKYCANCKKRPHFDKEERKFILTNYCPNCGAKMRGD